MKKYNTPHRHRVIKTRLTEEEFAEFSERVTLCKMSQSEFIRQALIKSSIRPVITVSPVNEELLSAVGKLTAEYGKIGGNLNHPEDTPHARIYDRLLEMCCPVCITGENFRKAKAQAKMERLKTLLNRKESL